MVWAAALVKAPVRVGETGGGAVVVVAVGLLAEAEEDVALANEGTLDATLGGETGVVGLAGEATGFVEEVVLTGTGTLDGEETDGVAVVGLAGCAAGLAGAAGFAGDTEFGLDGDVVVGGFAAGARVVVDLGVVAVAVAGFLLRPSITRCVLSIWPMLKPIVRISSLVTMGSRSNVIP